MFQHLRQYAKEVTTIGDRRISSDIILPGRFKRVYDKILLSWNALMIAAFSMLYRISRKPLYLDAAKRARDFLLTNLTDGAQLYGVWRNGAHSEIAFLDDYAFFAAGLLELYNSTLDAADLNAAMRFCDEAVRRFADADGGFTMCESGSIHDVLTDKNAA